MKVSRALPGLLFVTATSLAIAGVQPEALGGAGAGFAEAHGEDHELQGPSTLEGESFPLSGSKIGVVEGTQVASRHVLSCEIM